jgi:hypothetical protein
MAAGTGAAAAAGTIPVGGGSKLMSERPRLDIRANRAATEYSRGELVRRAPLTLAAAVQARPRVLHGWQTECCAFSTRRTTSQGANLCAGTHDSTRRGLRCRNRPCASRMRLDLRLPNRHVSCCHPGLTRESVGTLGRERQSEARKYSDREMALRVLWSLLSPAFG